MEYRKLIKFGKNSFVISLPKSWIEKNHLKKSDLLYLAVESDQLVITPEPKTGMNEERELSVDVDRVVPGSLRRRLKSSYIDNYHVITFFGKTIPQQADHIREEVNDLMALEIVEQTPTKIVAKNYLNMNEISLSETLRKVDNILRYEFVILKNILTKKIEGTKEDVIKEAYRMDGDINRLMFLLLRTVKFLSNTAEISRGKNVINNEDLLRIWMLISVLEKIGDELKRLIKKLISAKQLVKEKDLLFIVDQIEDAFKQAMKSFYLKDVELAFKVSEDNKVRLKKLILDFLEKNTSNVFVASMRENFVNLYYNIVEIPRLQY
ncbi:MAG: AbrB/MazE/SpoVT family DNA-binding domain-containing protein [Candidatus Woesearchaeota archaeon]|nr:MAG: AbrB/MazE/SpoVT family DNA-binding domain-containing protein [Candidatus Woesearchaeota archaeon]